MPSLLDRTVREYLTEAAANAPTPGGGSVSALVAALGASMGSMAANFTIGRKKFAAVETEVQGILDTLAAARKELEACVDEDTIAFAGIGAAYGMPKESEAEQAARAAAIQAATLAAMAVPLRLMRAAVGALEPLPRLAAIGNPNLVSDTGVAAILLEAAVRGAWLNVLINLTGLKDRAAADAARAESRELLARAAHLATETGSRVEKTIEG